MSGEPRATRHELTVGLFVILGGLAGLATLFLLTDPALFRGRYVVRTVVQDAAGVRRGDPVQLRGVNIGRVQRFRIQAEKVEISLEIEGEYEFPADSSVVLKASGLLGGTVVDIQPGHAEHWARGGDELPGKTEPGIMETAYKMAERAQKTLDQVNKLLSDENLENVRRGTADLRATLASASKMVEEQRGSLRSLEASLQKTADQVQALTAKPELQGLPEQMSATMARFKSVSESLERSSASLEQVGGRLERGEGTLGKLSADPALYQSLDEATRSLDKAGQELQALVADIKKQPKRYLKFSVF